MASWRPRWWERAECWGEDSETFFPPDYARGRNRDSYVNIARRVCTRCPVKYECLRDALQHGERYGVFGGCDMEKLSNEKRDRLQRWVELQIAIHGTVDERVA